MLSGLSEWNRVSGWETVVWGILVALIACGLSLRRQPAPVVVLAAAAALAAGVSSRNMPLFGVITVFVLGRTLLPGAGRNPARPARDIKPNLLSQAAALARKFEMRPAGAGGWVWAVAAPLLAVAAVGLRAAPVNLELDLSRYPVAAVRFVEAGGYPGNLFVRETWSSYLLWTAPERRLFYDAKGGFSPEAVRAHSELVKPGPDWQAVADRYRVSTFLLERGSPLTVVLSEASDWHQVYSDSTAEVFVRRGTQPNSPGSASAHASLPTH
jgi:hypothetical protein